MHISTYERLKQQCRGSSSSECQTINHMGGLRSGMPMEDAMIPASKVVENYDANGKSVSYTLIDARSNPPTMIMEPLEFDAYRNASRGTQALMQLSPQYALDFASAGLYSATGDNGRATEHVVSGVTSRDYVRDVGLGVAGAGVSAIPGGKPSAADAAKSTVSAKPTPDPLLSEANFAGRGTVREDLVNHLVDQKIIGKQISGGHDLNNFTAALDNAGRKVLARVEQGRGIYEIKYQLPNSSKAATKTVYDPSVFPNMPDMASQAAKRALIRFPLTGVLEQSVVVNGVEFFVPIRVTAGKPPSVPTAYPLRSVK